MNNRNEINETNAVFQDAGKNSVTENLRTGSEILKKAGTFTPNPEAKIAVQTAGSLLEAGANAKEILDRKKAEKEAREKAAANELGNLTGVAFSGESEKKNEFLISDKTDYFNEGEIKNLTPQEIDMQDEMVDSIDNPDELTKQEKGNLGEGTIDKYLREKGYTQLNETGVTSIKDAGHQGIDGVHYNPDGQPPYLIVEVKYGSGTLGDTADGKQMSQQWIENRLDDAVGKETADEIRKEMQKNPDNVGILLAHVDNEKNVTFDRLDKDGNIIEKNIEL